MENVGSDNARRDFAYLRAFQPIDRQPSDLLVEVSSNQCEFHRSTLSTRMENAVSMHLSRKKTARFVLLRIEDKQVK